MKGQDDEHKMAENQQIEDIVKCPECNSRALERDETRGEVVCQECGLVIEDNVIDQGAEWRVFSPEQGDQRGRGAEGLGEERLDRDDDDVEGLFYLGAAAGNLGRFYGMEDRWLKAYWHGRRGKNALLSLVEIDPDYNDAYLGLGIYHYYSAVLPKIVRTLSYVMGIRGDKNLGL